MTHEPPVRRVVVEPTQLELWGRPEQRLRRITIGELAPWVARRGSTFAMDTQTTIRAIHVAQRRLSGLSRGATASRAWF